jgi:hypothetical protein
MSNGVFIVKSTVVLAAVIASGVSTSVAAQSLENMSVEAGLSTLGFYIAPKMDVSPQWQVRVPLYLGSVSDTFDVDGSDIRGKLTSNSIAMVGDYAIGNSGLRVSGGVSFGGYKLEGSASTLTIEGNRYDGNFASTIEQRNTVAPVLAVGYARDLGENWGIMAEVGARFTSLKVSTTGQEVLDPVVRNQFNFDLEQANRDLRDVKILPFVTLGVTYKF